MIKKVFAGILNIIKGMRTVGRHYFRHSVTLEYPEKKRIMPERFKGRVALTVNENGELNCTGCSLCVNACPCKDLIKITKEKDEEGKNMVKDFSIDIGRCIFCGNCQSVCPKKSIVLTSDYELATPDKNDLILHTDDLKLSVEESKKYMAKEQKNG